MWAQKITDWADRGKGFLDIVKSVFSLLFGLILFVGILYLAYISTKFIGKRYSLNGRAGRNLKILETLSVGRDMSIAIAKVGERIFLIGITEDSINMLSELKEDDLALDAADDEQAVKAAGGISFSDALKYNINKKLGKDVSLSDYTSDKQKAEDSHDE